MLDLCAFPDTIHGDLPLIQTSLAGPSIAITILTLIICIYGALWLLRSSDEVAVDFIVEVPDQCNPSWSGKILDSPSLKVSKLQRSSLKVTQASIRFLALVPFSAIALPMGGYWKLSTRLRLLRVGARCDAEAYLGPDLPRSHRCSR